MAGVIDVVWKNPAFRQSPLERRIVVSGNRCEYAGEVSAVLRTSDLDIDALDPARRAAAANAFARLCNTLECPMQLLVQIRRFAPCQAPATEAHPEFDKAMHQYWSDRYLGGAKHSHRVYVALRAGTTDLLDSTCAHTAERLSALGIATHRLDGKELSDLVLRDHSAGGDWTPWDEHARYLSFNGLLTRGFALRRLPGHAVQAGWLAPLLSIQAECDIAIHMDPAPLGAAINQLNRKLRDLSAHRMLETDRGALGDIHVDIGLDAASSLRERLARNVGRPVHISVVATARAHSLDELDACGDALRLGFAAALIGAEVTHFRHKAAFTSTMPLAIDVLHARKLVELDRRRNVHPLGRRRVLRSWWLQTRLRDSLRSAGSRRAVRH